MQFYCSHPVLLQLMFYFIAMILLWGPIFEKFYLERMRQMVMFCLLVTLLKGLFFI